MARPSIWARAYATIPTLASDVWVDGVILDVYLLSVWYSVQGRAHVRLVDIVSAMISFDTQGNHQMPTQAEIQLFQQRFYITPGASDQTRSIGFIVFDHQHYFTVVFNYTTGTAYVLGRRISQGCEHVDEELDNWEMWKGPLYWIRIARLHGLNPGDANDVVVITKNWVQNGRDCGPIAAFVLKHFLDCGFEDDRNVRLPTIPCGHQLRLRMLGTVREACRTSWTDYNMLTTSHLPHNDIWFAWDDTAFVADEEIAAMENEASSQQYAPVVRSLNIICANCTTCQRHPTTEQDMVQSGDNITDDDPERNTDDEDDEEGDEDMEEDEKNKNENGQQSTKAARLRKLFRLNPDTRLARCRDSMPLRALKAKLPEDEDSSINHRKHVKNWSAGTMFRFPRPTKPVDLPAYTGQRWLPFNRDFDDYEGAPTYESMPPYRNPYEFVVEPYYRQGLWSMFRDYGWRLLPSFHQMFYLEEPLYVLDHVMVVGMPDDYEPAQQMSAHVTGM